MNCVKVVYSSSGQYCQNEYGVPLRHTEDMMYVNLVGSWKILNKQLWTKDKDWYSRLGVGYGANNFIAVNY